MYLYILKLKSEIDEKAALRKGLEKLFKIDKKGLPKRMVRLLDSVPARRSAYKVIGQTYCGNGLFCCFGAKMNMRRK